MKHHSILIAFTFFIPVFVYASSQNYDEFIYKKPKEQISFLQKCLKSLNQKPFDGSYAVIVSISAYDHLPSLSTATMDMNKMKSFLVESAEYDEIVTLEDADASFETVRYFMQSYFTGKMAQKGRYRFLFYFAGHSTQHVGTGGEQIGYLQLKEATGKPDDLATISMSQIVRWASRFQYANHMLFLLDTCFSGLAGTTRGGGPYDTSANLLELAKGNGYFLITAGGADEVSIADPKRWGGGLFTDVLLTGMRGYADSNNDSVVTIYELFSYTRAAVSNEAHNVGHEQNPRLINLGQPLDNGEYFFVYKDVVLPSPAPPPGIMSAIIERGEFRGPFFTSSSSKELSVNSSLNSRRISSSRSSSSSSSSW